MVKKDGYYLAYDWVSGFSEGLAKVAKDGKWGFIDRTGQVVLDLEYDWAWNFSDGLAKVQKDYEYFYINKNGKRPIGGYGKLY